MILTMQLFINDGFEKRVQEVDFTKHKEINLKINEISVQLLFDKEKTEKYGCMFYAVHINEKPLFQPAAAVYAYVDFSEDLKFRYTCSKQLKIKLIGEALRLKETDYRNDETITHWVDPRQEIKK